MTLTRRGKLLIFATAAIAAFLLGAFAPWDRLPWNASPPPSAPAPSAPHAASSEDDPGWQCALQGNRICGPDLDSALAQCDIQVPEPEENDDCRFAQLNYWEGRS